MKNMFKTINQKLQAQQYDLALQLYYEYERDIEACEDDKLVLFFRAYFTLLSENLNNFFKTNFTSIFQSYFLSSFDYFSQAGE